MSKIAIVVVSIVAVIAVAGVALGAVALFRSHSLSPVGMMVQARNGFAFNNQNGVDRDGGTYGQGRMGGGNRGMMNGFGFNDNDENRRGNFAGTAGFEPGLLHEKMIAAMADKLGYTVDELNQQFTDGKSLLDIAAEKNMTVAELIQMQTDVKTQVIDQALKDKLITQAQADFMKQNDGHMGFGMGMHGFGFGGKGFSSSDQTGQPENTQPTTAPTVQPTQQ